MYWLNIDIIKFILKLCIYYEISTLLFHDWLCVICSLHENAGIIITKQFFVETSEMCSETNYSIPNTKSKRFVTRKKDSIRELNKKEGEENHSFPSCYNIEQLKYSKVLFLRKLAKFRFPDIFAFFTELRRYANTFLEQFKASLLLREGVKKLLFYWHVRKPPAPPLPVLRTKWCFFFGGGEN